MIGFSREIVSKGGSTIRHLSALLAGASYPLAFSPFGLWWMGLISFIVFLYSVDVSSKRDIFIRYYIFAVGMYGTGVSWIFVSINEFGGVPLLVAGGLISAFVLSYSLTSLIGAFLHVNVRDWLVAFPAIWVILEWFRSWFLTGFPWLFAGYSHLDSPLSSYIPLVGVYGLSLFTAVTAVLIYKLRSPKWPLNVLTLGLLWGGGAFIAGSVNWISPTKNVVTVSAIQGNIDQHTKWLPSSAQTITKTYLGMTEKEWGRDIIVWPEAAITVFRQDANRLLKELDEQGLKDFCASFQNAIVENLIRKAFRACMKMNTKELALVGGVAANSRLRERALTRAKRENYKVYLPSRKNCTDNAAMIAHAGRLRLLKGERHELSRSARSQWTPGVE
mgnify:CR=1 FL=1